MFDHYAETIKRLSCSLAQGRLPSELLIEESGALSVYYAPFDYINTQARIVICGITPGLQQAVLALNEARRQLKDGASHEAALQAAKSTASFGGPMRANLIRLLDYVGLPDKLGIPSCSALFGGSSGLVHYTSALRYPVFKSGRNYSGSPSMVSHRFLRKQLERNLLPELQQFSRPTFIVPLGPKVDAAMDFAVERGALRPEQVLSGLPHPSGANAERIAYFLGEKPASRLSSKTNPEKIDTARENVISKVAAM